MIPKNTFNALASDLRILWLSDFDKQFGSAEMHCHPTYKTREDFVNDRVIGNVFLKFMRECKYYTSATWQDKWDMTTDLLKALSKEMDEDPYHDLTKEEKKIASKTFSMRLKRGACIAVHQLRIDLNVWLNKNKRESDAALKKWFDNPNPPKVRLIPDPYHQGGQLRVESNGPTSTVSYEQPWTEGQKRSVMVGIPPLIPSY